MNMMQWCGLLTLNCVLKAQDDLLTYKFGGPGGGGAGKALTMTMTPWNLPYSQWSKNLTIATDTLEFAPWSMVEMDILSSIS